MSGLTGCGAVQEMEVGPQLRPWKWCMTGLLMAGVASWTETATA